MIEKVRDKIYECEVRRRRTRAQGGYEAFWKVKSVQEAVEDNDTEFRCKDCHGAVKLYKRKAGATPASHVEHVHKHDAEFCPAGTYFMQAQDGRTPRLSESPVQ